MFGVIVVVCANICRDNISGVDTFFYKVVVYACYASYGIAAAGYVSCIVAVGNNTCFSAVVVAGYTAYIYSVIGDDIGQVAAVFDVSEIIAYYCPAVAAEFYLAVGCQC